MRSLFVLSFSFALFLVPLFSVGGLALDEAEPEVEPDWILYGVWEGAQGDRFATTHPVASLCVVSEGPVRLVLAGADPQQHPGYLFEPGPDGPHCRTGLGGGFEMVVAEAQGPVRVLVFSVGMRVLDQPGVTPLGDAGSIIVVRGVTSEGVLSMAPGGQGLGVMVFQWGSLEPLQIDEEGREWWVEQVVGSDGVVVLVAEAGQGGMLRWSEPSWHSVAPTIGEALVPVVLALMVALFRGGAGKDGFIRPPKS